MNCVLCLDKLFVCEECRPLTPWPCARNHPVGMPCPVCNPDVALPAGYQSFARSSEREQH